LRHETGVRHVTQLFRFITDLAASLIANLIEVLAVALADFAGGSLRRL
jgi:hypothetical protein